MWNLCYNCITITYHLGRPEVPTNVTVKRTALTTVLVSWVPGYNGGADCTFTVQFKKSDSNTWTSAAAVGTNATSTELSNSKSWDGLFVFRVTAVNEFGSSESNEVSVTLKGLFYSIFALFFYDFPMWPPLNNVVLVLSQVYEFIN